MEMIKRILLLIFFLVAIRFVFFYLLVAEIYLDLTNIKGKGKNGKDGKQY